jgi:guanine nucleotide-binding protein G(I)/G(S)/G(T) subunit beta-1
MQRRILRGHYGKIYAMEWSRDSVHLVSASQDGKLIIWNANTTNKVLAIALRSSWVMACAFSPSGTFVASGGLDNACSLWRLPPAEREGEEAKLVCELQNHEGYISSIKFVGSADQEVLTSSGDSTIALWDVTKRTVKTLFNDHQGDVMALDLIEEKNAFISGSIDATSKLWDYRAGPKAQATFVGHESDINTVKTAPGGLAFASGSDDATCRLFDIRALREVQRFASSKIVCGVTSIAFSKSGRILFSGYEDANLYLWDTLAGEWIEHVTQHDLRISCLGVAPDGTALCSGSWDHMLKIWA